LNPISSRAELYHSMCKASMEGQTYSFPHCDSFILHSPSSDCIYCKMPEFESFHDIRRELELRYTGERYPLGWEQCPAEVRRGLDTVEKWHGNLPVTPEMEFEEDEEWSNTLAALRQLVQAQDH